MSVDKRESSVFEEFVDFYIQEVWSVAESIIFLGDRLKSVDTIVQIRNRAKGKKIISISNEPHEIASSILSHASRLHKLFLCTSQRKDEEKEKFKLRINRAKFLRKELLPKKKVGHELFKSGVRNSVEHFDERLDLMVSKVIEDDATVSSKAILYNVTISSKEVFQDWSQVLPIKVFLVDSFEYYMADHKFEPHTVSLNEIFSEAEYIAMKCKEWAASRFGITAAGGILKKPKHGL